MNKIFKSVDVHEPLNEWNFPEIPLAIEKNNDQKEVELTEDEQQALIQAEEIKHKEFKRMEEIATLKNEYESKIAYINKILAELENPLTVIDKEFIEILELIIKKTVKNIIYKELKSDAKLIPKMIAELQELITNQNGLVTVFVSKNDFDRLDKTKNQVIKVNPDLQDGDIIIKSNSGEIQAILNERINTIIGNKNT